MIDVVSQFLSLDPRIHNVYTHPGGARADNEP